MQQGKITLFYLDRNVFKNALFVMFVDGLLENVHTLTWTYTIYLSRMLTILNDKYSQHQLLVTFFRNF